MSFCVFKSNNFLGEFISNKYIESESSDESNARERSVFGRRVLDNRYEYNWQELDIDQFVIHAPTIFCLPGNGAKSNRQINAYCKFAENLLGNRISDNTQGNFLRGVNDDLNILGVRYDSDLYGELSNSTKERLANMLFRSFCIDSQGNLLPISDIKKNASMLTFFTYCQGAKEVYYILSDLKKFLLIRGVDNRDVYDIFEQILQISYAPNENTELSPYVFFMSGRDSSCPEMIRDDYYDKNQIDMYLIHGQKDYVDHDGISVYASNLLDPRYSRDEHDISILYRDENWNLVPIKHATIGENRNADCVSQMLSYALSRSVANSIENLHSEKFIPKISLEQLKVEMSDISRSFGLEKEM